MDPTGLNNSHVILFGAYHKQLILPTLNYCASIWDPHQQYLINKMEMIQQGAACEPPVVKLHCDSITLMLSKLQWPNLKKEC